MEEGGEAAKVPLLSLHDYQHGRIRGGGLGRAYAPYFFAKQCVLMVFYSNSANRTGNSQYLFSDARKMLLKHPIM